MSKKSFNFSLDMEIDLKNIKSFLLRQGYDLNNTEILEIALHFLNHSCYFDKDYLISYIKDNYS